MDYIEVALRELKRTAGEVQSEIISDLIDGHAPARNRMMNLYERYKATEQGVPVLTRTFEDKTKINNRLNNDFMSDIIDTKVGYFAGKPVSYLLDKEADNYEKKAETIASFTTRCSIEDLDAETAKMAAICGYGARLCYVNREGLEMVINVDPWEAIFIADMSINEPQYSMRYYKIWIKAEGSREWVERWRVEWYDDLYLTNFIEADDGGFRVDPDEPGGPHMFGDVPLFGIPNNEEMQGDAEKVLALIDGYDNALSDVNSEIEQFRLAYLAFYGIEVDEDTLARAKKTGAFNFPDTDGKMEFVTKLLDDNIVEHHLDRMENNIMRFSKSVNFTDDQFAGTQSGVALRYKMLALESKCITAERKFAAALRKMFKILATAWRAKGIDIDYTDVFFEFKRNFPLNLLDEAETTAKLRGQVSEQTRLSLLSFVDDADYEKELMEQDMAGRVDLDAVVDEDEPE